MLVVRFVSFAVCTAHSHHPALRYLPRLCLLSSRKVIRIHIDYANNRGRGHPNPTVHFIFEFWRNALFLYPSIHPPVPYLAGCHFKILVAGPGAEKDSTIALICTVASIGGR